MKVIICGAGHVGYNIAKYISAQKIDVAVIDQSKTLIGKISDSLDVQAYIGHASDPEVMRRAGAKDADILIAVTRDDEVNMVACQIGHSLFDIGTKIARIRNRHYINPEAGVLFSDDNIPVDVVIAPEALVAKHISRILNHPKGVLETLPMADGLVEIISVRCSDNCPIIKTPLRQLTSLFPDLPMRILAIIRNKEYIIPSAQEQINPHDEVIFSVAKDDIDRALACFDINSDAKGNAIIVGGGRVAQNLAELLNEDTTVKNVTIIEKNREQALMAAERLPHTNVIYGDALDEQILQEAGINENDSLIAVSNNDETNIFASLIAKKMGAHRSIAIATSGIYDKISDSFNIDTIIRPSEITTSSILRYIRLGRIYASYSLHNGFAEILEAEILEMSPLAGNSLRDKRGNGDMIAGAIIRDGAVIVPRGDTVFKVGDKVIFIASKNTVRRAEKLFSAGLGYDI